MSKYQFVAFVFLFAMGFINLAVACRSMHAINETAQTTNYVYGLLDLVNRNVVNSGCCCR
ncbi:hypothetical protein M0Q28_04415 [Patescibacteria group bacterium]|jgi:hypothetical protein|nr:hypothetical protein [Patescibacteria group bacterium]